MKLEDIWVFVRQHDLMMLATVTAEGKPEASVVEFGETDDFTIIIDTLMSSRKYENLQENPEVAMVIGWDDSITVQLEGRAEELSGRALEQAQQAYFAKNPRAKKWANRPEVAYFTIKPSWLRYSDLNQNPWQVEELDIPQVN